MRTIRSGTIAVGSMMLLGHFVAPGVARPADFDFERYYRSVAGVAPLYDKVRGTGHYTMRWRDGSRRELDVEFAIDGPHCRVVIRGADGAEEVYCTDQQHTFAVERGGAVERARLKSRGSPGMSFPGINMYFTHYFFAPMGFAPNPGEAFTVTFGDRERPRTRMNEMPSFRVTGSEDVEIDGVRCRKLRFKVKDVNGQGLTGSAVFNPARGWLLERMEFAYDGSARHTSVIEVDYPEGPPRPSLPKRVVLDQFGQVSEFCFDRIEPYAFDAREFSLAHYGLADLESPPAASRWPSARALLAGTAAICLVLAVGLKRASTGRRA